MADDLERQLERWGEETTPAPDPAFANRLEADLRSAVYFGQRTPAPEPRRRWVLRPAFVMAAVVLIALVAAVALNVADDRPAETLVMGDSSGTTVTLPGGSVQAGGEGLELPDGTVIDVGPDGFATIDGVVLPPDSRAVVVDGHLELFDSPDGDPPDRDDPTGESDVPTADAAAPAPTATPTAGDASTPLPTDRQPTPTVRPTSTPAPTRRPADVAPDPTPTRAPTTPPTTQPTARPTDLAPTATPAPTPSATATPSPTSPAPPTPRPEPVRPRVDLGRTYLGPERAALVWSVTNGDAIAGWEVRIRRGDTIRTVAVIRNAAARELVVERPMRNSLFYRVIARNAAGEVLARSDEVRVVAAEVQPDG